MDTLATTLTNVPPEVTTVMQKRIAQIWQVPSVVHAGKGLLEMVSDVKVILFNSEKCKNFCQNIKS